MRTLMRFLKTVVIIGLGIVGFAILPASLEASANGINNQHFHSAQSTEAGSSAHGGGTTSVRTLRQERNSLALTGLGFLVIGTAVRMRRRVSEDQPVVTDALVSQTQLPLAS